MSNRIITEPEDDDDDFDEDDQEYYDNVDLFRCECPQCGGSGRQSNDIMNCVECDMCDGDGTMLTDGYEYFIDD